MKMRRYLYYYLLLFSVLLTGLICLSGVTMKTYAASSDFEIKEGVLIKYNGKSKSVQIPEGVKRINKDAFSEDCKVETLIIPEGVKDIEEGAFNYIKTLKTVKLPESLTEIKDWTFSNCINLTTVNIPKSVTKIGFMAFDNCKKLKNITLPDKLEVIDNYAFSDCKLLTEIIIPSNTYYIGGGAFQGCVALKKIVIPKSVSKFGCNVFNDTPWIKEKRKSNPYVQVNGILIDVSAVKGKITIPKNVIGLAEELFMQSDITSITIPGTIKEIPDFTFHYAVNLSSVIIEDGVEKIGESAFEGVKSLKKITIPPSVKYISDKAFMDCTSLSTVTLKKGLKEIGSEAFYRCRSLKQITIPSTVSKLGEGIFNNCTALEKATINGKMASIPPYAFFNCTALKSVTISDSVKVIDNSAFCNGYRITSIKLPKNLTKIGDAAFAGCVSLKEVELGDKLKSIGECGFAGCFQLKKLVLPKSLVSLGAGALYECKSVENFKLPETVKDIGFMALHGCGKSLITKGKANKGYAGTYNIWGYKFPKLQYFAYDCAVEEGELYGADSKTVTRYADSIIELNDLFMAYLNEKRTSVDEYPFPGIEIRGLSYYSTFGLSVTGIYNNMSLHKSDIFGEPGYMIKIETDYVLGSASLTPSSMDRIRKNENLKAYCAGVSSTPDKLYYAIYDAWMNDNSYKINDKTWVVIGDSKVRSNEEGNCFYLIEK